MRQTRDDHRAATLAGPQGADIFKDFKRSGSPGARHKFVASTVFTEETEVQRQRHDFSGSVVGAADMMRKTLPPKNFLAESGFLSDSGIFSDGSGDEKKPKNVNFQPNSKWKNSKHCHICKRVFDQLQGIFRHHCRLCANSVCGQCSLKRVENKRICDVCDFKSNNNELKKEEMRANCLNHMDSQIQAKKELIKSLEYELEEREFVVNKFSENAVKEEQQSLTHLQKLEEECNKIHTMMKKIKEMNERSRQVIEAEMQEIAEKKKIYTNLSSKLKQLNLEIMNKKTAWLMKVDEFTKRSDPSYPQKGKRYDRSESLVSTSALLSGEDFITRDERSETFHGYSNSAVNALNVSGTYEYRKPSFIKDGQTSSFIGNVPPKRTGLCGF